MGVEDQRDGCVRAGLVVVARLDPPGGAANIDFRHRTLASTRVTLQGTDRRLDFERWEARNAAAKLDSAALETYTI
jgi:hypothetical protein